MHEQEFHECEDQAPDASAAAISIETALTRVGCGRWQYIILLACGLGNAADAVEILAVGLVLPVAGDDLQLGPGAKGALSACIFFGMLCGGLVWGQLGDALGRKWSLVSALLLNAVFGALAAGAGTWQTLAVLRFVAGVGVGGSVPLVFSFMSEHSASANRGKLLVGVASFWMVGSIYSAAMGWAVIPTAGWRAFLLVATFPAVAAAFLTAVFGRESPRYLLSTGDVHAAEAVLQHAARHNGTTAALGTFSLLRPHGIARARPGMLLHRANGWRARVRQGLIDYAERLMGLFQDGRARDTMALIVAFAAMSFGWYGTSLWMPTVFAARGASGSQLYKENLLVALANGPGNLLSALTIDRAGRRVPLMLSMGGGACAVLLFAATPAQNAWGVMFVCAFNSLSVVGWNALDVVSIELFPTAIRSTGVGLMGAIGRLASASGGLVFSQLVSLSTWLPLAVAALTLLLGCMAAFHLPETAATQLHDSVHEESDGHAGESDVDETTDGMELIVKPVCALSSR